MQRIQFFLLSILLVAAVAQTHQLTSQGDKLQSWRRAIRSRSRTIKITNWENESATTSFKNDSEYLTEGPSQEADYLPQGLPGQPAGFKFRQHSGYVTVDAEAGRALFYYFAEATQNSYNKPLVLWLNGGPGCSSLGFGAMAELGPFRVNPDGRTLSDNPYAWNQAANVLFLESPAGVGFSYTNTTSDYTQTGDKLTAEQSYAFLVNWFNRFPQFKFRRFYIAGESYAGYYIPELASKILQQKKLSQASFINFRGIMVGNGVMNSDTDFIGTFQYAWNHALISDQLYEQLIGSCNASKFDVALCNELEEKAYAEMGDIDIFSIYSPTCIENSSQTARVSETYQEQAEMRGYDPCIDNYVEAYFNRPEVQKAIHANVTNITYSWSHCSGDTDARVPVTATRLAINELKLTIETPWYAWVNDDEVGGYAVIYNGLTFATVRGAGHEVPEFQPSRVLTLFTYFVKEAALPKRSDLIEMVISKGKASPDFIEIASN
eukprot:PITA_28270